MKKIDQTYEFIKDYINKKEYPPTIREISEALNIKSTSTVAYYLKKLEENNKIIKGNYKNRSIQLIENVANKSQDNDLVVMPYIGKVVQGQPLFSEQNINEKFLLSAGLFKGLDMFMIDVRDNSMRSSNIVLGDKLVVSRQNVARNGELVVAVAAGNYVVARLYREFNFYKLEFDSKDYEPIYVEKPILLGKVVGVIRNDI